jgi:alanyl-tRNA synthetase
MIAYTSKGAFEYLRAKDLEVKTIRDRLKASSSDEILGKIDRLTATERELRKQIEQFQAKSASGEVDEILSKAQTLPGVRIVMSLCAPDSQGVKRLRDLSDRIKQKAADSVIILGMKDPESEKASLLVAVGPSAPKSMNANELLKNIAPLIDGRGGGKPDLAQAGGTKSSGLPEALNQAKAWVEKVLAS